MTRTDRRRLRLPPLPRSPSLAEWLEHNVRYVEAAVTVLPPGGDLPPTLVAHHDDRPADVMTVGWQNPAQKAHVIGAFRLFLRERAADRYAVISAGWEIAVPAAEAAEAEAVVARQGSAGTRWEQRRIEVYYVAAGDKAGTLLQTLTVGRNEGGRIIKLTRSRGPTSSSDLNHALLRGQMIDLLVEVH